MRMKIRARLRSVRNKIVGRMLPAGVTAGLNRNDREGALNRAWGHVFTSQIKGGYYEFGVYEGETFRTSYRVYQGFYRWQREQLDSPEPWRQKVAAEYSQYLHHFYAFDSFQGLPENNEGSATFIPGGFLCSLEQFSNLNRAAGIIPSEAVRYFEGMFSDVHEREADTLEKLQPAAIVNLDCDLYSSAKDALAIVGPKLVQGSVLLADDWNTFAADGDQGERKAIKEFEFDHPEISLDPWFSYHYTGQAFLVQFPK